VIKLKVPPGKDIPRSHRTAEIPANSSATVFTYNIPSGYVGWIFRIGYNLYQNTYWELYIDKMLWKNQKLRYIIAFINSPKDVVIGPIFHSIRFIAYNENDESVDMECVLEGKIYPLPETLIKEV